MNNDSAIPDPSDHEPPIPTGTYTPIEKLRGLNPMPFEFQTQREHRRSWAQKAPEEAPWWFEPAGTWTPPRQVWGDDVPEEAKRQGGQYVNKLTNRPQQFRPANEDEIKEWSAKYQKARLAEWPWAYADLILDAEPVKL